MGKPLTFPEFAPLTGRWTGTKFLYAFQFSDGTVKVGRSSKPRERATVFAREFRRKGIRLVRFQQMPTQSMAHETERELIERMARMGVPAKGTIEWFRGVSWGAATTLLRQIASREIKYVC